MFYMLKQALTELGQAQYKLGFYLTLIFCRFGLSRFDLGRPNMILYYAGGGSESIFYVDVSK